MNSNRYTLHRKQQTMQKGSTIIFVNTRARAEFLVKHLVACSIAATCVHGELIADERRDSLRMFSKGHTEVLVATGEFEFISNLSELDLQFIIITHVINFDLPYTHHQYYVQCGRACRDGFVGVAMTIVPSVKEKHTNRWFFQEMRQRCTRLACLERRGFEVEGGGS